MRRASALGVSAASCAALIGAWRLGQAPQAVGTQGLATPVTNQPGTSTAAPSTAGASPSPSKSKSKSKKPSATTSPTHAAIARSFDGAAQQTQFGTVQVRAVVKGGKLIDVVALHLTDSGGRSVSISAYSAPILRREALAAGSARINAVSGASYTSAGYIQSLQSALDAARAAGA